MQLPVPPYTPAGQLVLSGQMISLENCASFLLDPPRCQLIQNAGQNLASGVSTNLTWDAEVYDTDGMHSTSTNSQRITIQTPGTYSVSYTVGVPSGSYSIRCYLEKNGAYYQGGTTVLNSSASPDITGGATVDVPCVAGDYLQVVVNPTAAVTTNANSAQYGSMFQVRWVANS